MNSENESWDLIVKPKNSWFDFNLKEVWKYRDLIFLFVKRDFVSVYKQTILGPLWYIIQPLLNTLTLVFIGIAGNLSHGSIPQFLFSLSGQVIWNFFAMSLTKTSNTFISNANIFGKVYFPRLVMPISVIISNYIAQAIQIGIFICFYFIYILNGHNFQFNVIQLIGFLYIILISSLLSFGFGIFISSITTKYRDFTFLINTCIQLAMYGSTVMWDTTSNVPDWAKQLIMLNPMSPLINYFRYIFFNLGSFDITYLAYSGIVGIIICFLGIIFFNQVEKSFMDTV
jgi:lipopolysaccharide transport system permease protein